MAEPGILPKRGGLVAIEDGGFLTIYERDKTGLVSKIVGVLGHRAVAFIDLTYNSSGQLISATGRRGNSRSGDEQTVRYEYDGTGRLSGTVSRTSRTGYRYQGPWVKAVTHAMLGKNAKPAEEVTLRAFEYNDLGQVTSMRSSDGRTSSQHITHHADGIAINSTISGNSSGTAFMRFDRAFRPMQITTADGVRASWTYPDTGGVNLDVTNPQGRTLHLAESSDQRRLMMTLDGYPPFIDEYDFEGRLTSFSQNGRTLLAQEWTPDGRLARLRDQFSAVHPTYDADGLLAKVTVSPPNEERQLRQWQSITLNTAGQPLEVTDFHGLHRSFAYSPSGDLESIAEHRAGKRYGFQIRRDKSGRVQRVDSSWGTLDYTYDHDGLLMSSRLIMEGKTALAEWKSGLVQAVRQLDGGELSFDYYHEEKRAGLLKEITTPDRLRLQYKYDTENRLSEVSVGDRYQIRLDYDSRGRLNAWRTHPMQH